MSLKITDNISPKTQHFLYTKFSSIEKHNQLNNHSKQGFYTKRGIPNPQTSIHTKIYNKIYTKSIQKFHTLISFFFLSSFVFFSFFSFLFSSPLLSFLLFRFALAKIKQNEFILKPCLALSKIWLTFLLLLFGHLFSF